jgi:hypothetical protein
MDIIHYDDIYSSKKHPNCDPIVAITEMVVEGDERGEIETLRVTLTNLTKLVGRLLDVLVTKEALTLDELEEIFSKYRINLVSKA